MHAHRHPAASSPGGAVHRAGALLFALAFALSFASTAAPPHGVVTPLAAAPLEPDTDVPCLTSAVESGDPDKGPSTFLLKAAPGCQVPPHYHTAGEQLIVVHGQVRTGMDAMATTMLGPGGFAAMPGKAAHWFSCRSKEPCLMFVLFDGPYDIVWVKGHR